MNQESRSNVSGEIRLESRFDFGYMNRFRDAYEALLANGAIREIVVNFSSVEYLDSSAMGMLMLLREKAQAANKSVRLTQVHGMALDLLKIANFDKVFTVN